MKLVLRVLIICCIAFKASANTNWNKLYKIVKKDIKTIESLRTRDIQLTIRLFELYGEKLTLLLEKESEYKIKFLEGSDNKKLERLKLVQKKNLRKIESIARKIEKRTSDTDVLAKVDYYRSLNYFLVKNYKLFYKYIKRAEKKNKNTKLAFNINMKLADYFYNEKNYIESRKYYQKLISNTESKWITKFHFNLAWSYLKLNKTKDALKHVKLAHMYSKKKGTFVIGDQLIDSVILFFAYTYETESGISYLKKNNLDSFKYLLKFIHYVFENGNKKSIGSLLHVIEEKKLTMDQEYLLLAKKVLIYRTLRQRKKLQSSFNHFKKMLKADNTHKVSNKSRSELVTSINSYTGYLQELIRSKRLIDEKTKKRYLKYVGANFHILKYVDPENGLKYSYYEGETYFSLKNYLRASYVYAIGIKIFKSSKLKRNEFLDKIFESLFKALELQRKPSEKILLYTYNSYLDFFPKRKKSSLIYQRLLNYHSKRKNERLVLENLKKYNKSFPGHINKQRSYYKAILNGYIDKKDLNSLRKLQALLKQKFLNFKKYEIKKISTIINQIRLDKFDELAKNNKTKEAIAGFTQLFNDDKNPRDLRVSALRKKMFYQEKRLDYISLSETLLGSLVFFNKVEIKKHSDELSFFTEKICVGDEHEACFKVTEEYYQIKELRKTATLDELRFKVHSLLNVSFNKTYKLATTHARKNYLLQTLLLSSPNFDSKNYNYFIEDEKLLTTINNLIKNKMWALYFRTLSVKRMKKFINNLSIISLKKELTTLVVSFENELRKVKIKLPKTPKAENITFEVFSEFNKKLVGDFLKINETINKGLLIINQSFAPQYLSNVIKEFEKEKGKLSNFIPTSTDLELEKAINKEMNNILYVIDQKILEFRRNYYKAVSATSPSSGGRKYFEGLMTNPIVYKLEGVNLWRN